MSHDSRSLKVTQAIEAVQLKTFQFLWESRLFGSPFIRDTLMFNSDIHRIARHRIPRLFTDKITDIK